MHYAAEVKHSMAHCEFEDTDLMRLILKYGGDTNISTKLVTSRHCVLDLRVMFVLIIQTLETSMHYCARAGNADIMLEIVKDLGPNRIQGAVNKQAKVQTRLSNSALWKAAFSFFVCSVERLVASTRGE